MNLLEDTAHTIFSRVLKGLQCGLKMEGELKEGERFLGVKNNKWQVDEESKILQFMIPT